jgi:hypothetical protein
VLNREQGIGKAREMFKGVMCMKLTCVKDGREG